MQGIPNGTILSSISYKKMGANSVHFIKLPVVITVQEKIGPYIAQLIKDKGLNYREVARRSNGAISHSAVGDIINGRVSDIGIETLRGLARGLGVPERELLDVAIGHGDPNSYLESRLLHLFNQLPLEQQKDVVAIVDALNERRAQEVTAESIPLDKIGIANTDEPERQLGQEPIKGGENAVLVGATAEDE